MIRTLWMAACLMCSCAAGVARADECDALVGRLIAQVPELTLESRAKNAGAADVVYLKHPQAKELSIFCPAPGVPWPALNVDWPDGLPPAGYFQLIGQMGGIMTETPADVIRTGAMKCQQQALAAKDEAADTETSGVSFECSAFTRDGGSTAITLIRHGK
jgi:hypothetical protein